VHIKKHLGFTALRRTIAKRFREIDDLRQAGKVDFSIHDCLMSGFAMMFFQDPSLLSFRRRLAQERQLGNLKTIFGVEAIPQDTQLRDSLDPLPLDAFDPVFDDLLSPLQRGKHLAEYRFLGGNYVFLI
jgi:hypothetical protein